MADEGDKPPPRRSLASAVSRLNLAKAGSSTKLQGGPRMLAAPLPTNADLDIEEAMDQVHYDSPFLTSRPSLVTPFEPRTRPPLTGTSAVKEPVADPEESQPSPAAVLVPRLSDLSKSPWSGSSGRQPASIMDVINAVNFEKKMAKKLHKNIQTRKRAAEAVSIVMKKGTNLEEELNSLSTNYISKLAQDHQTFVISIHSHIKVWWDAVMAVVTFYSIVVVPMDVCFDLSTTYDGVVSVQRTVEIVFVVDIILTFRTSYLSSVSLEEVMDVARIRQHYLTTWFWVDCLGSVPSDLLGTSCQQSQLAYLRLLVFLRILRLSTSPTFADLMSWASRTFTSYFVRLVVLTTMYLLLHHYIACSFYLLVVQWLSCLAHYILGARKTSHAYVLSIFIVIRTVPFDANDTLDVKYVSSYYRGLVVTSGSDLGPVTSAEQIWGTAMFIVGILANACVAGICASVLAQMNKVEDEQVHQKECIHNTLRHCNAGEDLQKRVLTFFDSAHGRETAHHAAEMFHGMPEKLHFELSVALNQSFLDKVPLFRTLEPEGIVALMECVEETVAMSGDVIIRAGEEVADDVSYKRMWNVPLAGHSFGEMSLLRNGVASASVVATSFCVLLVLYKDMFQWITRENDQVRTFWERSRVKQMETSETVVRRASLVSTVSDVTQQVGVIHYLANKVLPKRMRIMLRKVRMRKAARRVMLLHHQQINRTQALSSRCQDNLHSNTSNHSQRSDTSHISHVPPRLVPDGTAPGPTGPDGMAIHAADTPAPSSIHSPPTAADPPVDAEPKTSPKGSRLKGAAKKMRASPLSNAHMLLSMLKGRQMSARALLAVTKMSQIAAKDMVDATSITKENMLYRANET
ncbi:hypothetical protein DYB38_001719 [Aphanomyces astaci]|uniref:Cyclic nucleotide-binding domain-containing protein n=1 Tax=Aphanomyces astaci TaxID=112090 RepID=A0A397F2S1_APHAT|nr:hypothetical protein DYB38_001719 [Aphanomyces astaci]RHZ11358.1 hypothetical protein DYB31_006887 [Aphanomyces astaci]